MSDYAEREEASEIKGSIGAQLFSDLKTILKLQFDRTKLSRLKKPTQIPKGFSALVWLIAYAKTFGDTGVQNYTDVYLDLTNSIDGLAREEALRLESIFHGIAPTKDNKTPPHKPGRIDKLLNTEANKEYEEYLQWKELREVEKLE